LRDYVFCFGKFGIYCNQNKGKKLKERE